MRRTTLLLLATLLVGCKGTVGPLMSRQRPQNPDPLYNSEQQQRFFRGRFPYIEEDRKVAPDTYSDRYGPTGR